MLAVVGNLRACPMGPADHWRRRKKCMSGGRQLDAGAEFSHQSNNGFILRRMFCQIIGIFEFIPFSYGKIPWMFREMFFELQYFPFDEVFPVKSASVIILECLGKLLLVNFRSGYDRNHHEFKFYEGRVNLNFISGERRRVPTFGPRFED